ncbi:MAG: DUF4233 domain-containing protein [Micromonosporaceae bacterium]
MTSGLRNPARAVRGVGAGALAIEAVVLLLAIQPMRVLGARLTGMAVAVVIALAAICLGLAAAMSHRWAWWAGSAVPVALLVAGLAFHPALAGLGVLFGLVWLYVLHVRRSVLRTPALSERPPGPATE